MLPVLVNASPTEKVAKIMEAQGLLEMWQNQIELGKIESKRQIDQITEQFLAQLNPSKEFTKRFSTASKSLMQKLQGKWTAKEIVSIWAKYYTPKFTEKELDQLLKFYTSEIGQKEVKANKVTLTEFTKHFQKENQNIMKVALNEYIKDLKVLARECNCKKKK